MRFLLPASWVLLMAFTAGHSSVRAEEAAANSPKAAKGAFTRVDNVIYARVGEHALPLDLYLPADSSSKLRPAIVWLHGGAWSGGSKNGGVPTGLVSYGGYVVASVEYRLSGEAKFPAQIFDCKAAVRWLRANAAKYGIDPQRIGVIGASAGGHLAALLGTSGDTKELEGDEGNLNESSRVQAVCDISGPTDFVDIPAGIIGRSSPITQLLGGTPQEKPELARLASPVKFVSKDDPPFYLVYGGKDTLVPVIEASLLETALKGVGVNATLDLIPEDGHVPSDSGSRVRILEFFVRTLGKP